MHQGYEKKKKKKGSKLLSENSLTLQLLALYCQKS